MALSGELYNSSYTLGDFGIFKRQAWTLYLHEKRLTSQYGMGKVTTPPLNWHTFDQGYATASDSLKGCLRTGSCEVHVKTKGEESPGASLATLEQFHGR